MEYLGVEKEDTLVSLLEPSLLAIELYSANCEIDETLELARHDNTSGSIELISVTSRLRIENRSSLTSVPWERRVKDTNSTGKDIYMFSTQVCSCAISVPVLGDRIGLKHQVSAPLVF